MTESVLRVAVHKVYHIAHGALFCLRFARLPYFVSLGIPCSVGMLIAVLVAVTLVPAGLAVAGKFALLDPKGRVRAGRWRGVGTAIVRWPVPMLTVASALALVVFLLHLWGLQDQLEQDAQQQALLPQQR